MAASLQSRVRTIRTFSQQFSDHLHLARLWKHFKITSVSAIEAFSGFLAEFPDNCDYIVSVFVSLEWTAVSFDRSTLLNERWSMSALGDPAEFAFRDRAALERILESKQVPKEERHRKARSEIQLSEGPDGTGPLDEIKSVEDASHVLEGCIIQLGFLRNLGWHTGLVPMTARLCKHLGQLDTLHNIRIHAQGEYRSTKWTPPDLDQIFLPGKRFGYVCLDSELWDIGAYMHQAHVSEHADISMVELDTVRLRALYADLSFVGFEAVHFNWERIIHTPYEDLSWIEKGLAMATRALLAISKTDVTRLCVGPDSSAVFHFRETVALSLQLPLDEVSLRNRTAAPTYWLREVVRFWQACRTRVKIRQGDPASDGSSSLSPDDMLTLDNDDMFITVGLLAPLLATDQEFRDQVAASWDQAVARNKHQNRFPAIDHAERLRAAQGDDDWFLQQEISRDLW